MSLELWLSKCSGVHIQTISRLSNDLMKMLGITNKRRLRVYLSDIID